MIGNWNDTSCLSIYHLIWLPNFVNYVKSKIPIFAPLKNECITCIQTVVIDFSLSCSLWIAYIQIMNYYVIKLEDLPLERVTKNVSVIVWGHIKDIE